MAGKARHDWGYWKIKYVTGDDSVTLDLLSRSPNAPGLRAFKTRSAEESWAEQRKAFRHQTIAKVTESATTQQAAAQVQQLIDAAEVITRHLRLSKAMQSIAAKRLNNFDPMELSGKDLTAWINTAANLERLTMGMATERTEVNVTVDFAALSDEQLERLAKGEDPAHVLN